MCVCIKHIHIVNKEQEYWKSKVPSDITQGILFPKDKPSETKLYICGNKEYPFVDLTIREGKKIIPYCFKINHIQNITSSSIYKYDNEMYENEKSIGNTTYEKKTNQLLISKQRGSVLRWIYLLTIIYHPELTYSRVGVSPRYVTDSILWLLESVNQKKFLDFNNDNKALIKAKRTELFEKLRQRPGDIYTECKSNNISSYLTQFEQGYIDPLVYCSFLSRMYDTHLFFFTKQGMKSQSDEFYLIPPSYKHECTLIKENYSTTTLVCLNPGSDLNRLEYPLCELIVRYNRDSKPKNILTPTNTDHDLWKSTLRNMYGVKERTLPLQKEILKHISINENGHVSWLHTIEGSMAVLEPMHSINMSLSDAIKVWSPQLLNTFLENNSFEVLKEEYTYFQYNGKLIQKDGYTYFLPTFIRPKSNEKLIYDWYEKTSRYLIEYTQFSFSKYIHEKQINTQDQLYETIYEFSEKIFRINENVCKDPFPVSRKFKEHNKYYNETHITIPSLTVKKKIIYYLLQEYNINKERLLIYHKEHYMRNYYVKISDLNIYSNTLILYNQNAFLLYVKHQHDTIKQGRTGVYIEAVQPYILFKTIPELNASKFIMQPVESISHAFSVYQSWSTNKVNTWRIDTINNQPIHYDELIWSNESTYKFTSSGYMGSPTIALFPTNNGTIIQLMLSFQ